METTTCVLNEGLNVEDLPSGYIFIQKADGMYTYLKVEPEDDGEVIEEGPVDSDANSTVSELKTMTLLPANRADDTTDEAFVGEEEIIEDGAVLDDNSHLFTSRSADTQDGEIVDEEVDFNELPDILDDGIINDQTVTNDEVEFIGERAVFGKAKQKVVPSYKRKLTKTDGTSTSQLWRGVSIPAGLPMDKVELFKANYLLQKLSDRVKLNRQKVEVYTKKNDSLKKLVTKQREQMHKLGFHVRDIARVQYRRPDLERSLSPELDKSEMTAMEQMEYERKRLESHYHELRRQLKSLLSTYRAFKKRFVENHEKIQKGPKKVGLPSELLKKGHAQLRALAESDSDPEVLDMSAEAIAAQPFKCFHCKFRSETKEQLRNHMKKHMKEMRYRCPNCFFFTPKITQFIKHMKLHPGSKAFFCRYCDFRSAHPAGVRNHELTHSALKPFKCDECDFRTVRSDHLRNHMRTHSDAREFACSLCNFKCKFPSGLTKHKKNAHKGLGVKKKTHKEPPLIRMEKELEEDNETTEVEFNEDGTFVRITTLSRDMKQEMLQQADDDNTVTVIESNAKKRKLDDSIRTANDENNVVVECEVDKDGEAFGEKVNKSVERMKDCDGKEEDGDASVGGELDSGYFQVLRELCEAPAKDLLNSYVIYQCAFCHFSCEMKASLTAHMRTHMEMWIFSCKLCGYNASTPFDLRDHTEDHKHEGENGCSYCDYVAPDKESLKRHLDRRHPHGVPLACVFCDFISSNRPGMKKHMQIHKDKKQWQCVVCDFKAPFKSGLKRHLRKHTGERPYNCPLCEFNAAQYSHLTRHLRRFHPDEPDYLDERPCSPPSIF